MNIDIIDDVGGDFRSRGPAPGGRILIVEDEALVRMAIALDLTKAGYSVIEATSADEALDVLRTGQEVDLVFIDIRMPGCMNGLELARTTAECFPTLPMILTSGHCAPAPDMRPGIAFVPKPYSSLVVLQLIANRLGNRSRRDDLAAAAALRTSLPGDNEAIRREASLLPAEAAPT